MSSVIDLAQAWCGAGQALNQLSLELQTNGWAFVRLTDHLTVQLAALCPSLQAFFATSNALKEKYCDKLVKSSNDLDGAVYGYNRSGTRKEGLRLLTGTRLQDRWLPPECKEGLRLMVNQLDELMIAVCESLVPALFGGVSAEALAEEFHIPLLRKGIKDKSNAPGSGQFGMLDVVQYLNQAVPDNGLNCASHYDPGLFSLSVLSTQPGLQLQKASGEWVDGPVGVQDVGVIWAGELAAVASKGRIKPGVHRVVYPSAGAAPPRLAMWLECVGQMQDLALSGPLLASAKAPRDMVLTFPSAFDELLEPMMDSSEVKDDVQAVREASLHLSGVPPPKKLGISGVLSNIQKWRPGSNKKKPVRANLPRRGVLKVHVRESESLADALHRASMKFGMPMTKMITYYCPLCVRAVRSLQKHFLEHHADKSESVAADYQSDDE